MITLCYHNGALGHSTQALFECCTQEGSSDVPFFKKGSDLHHFLPKNHIIKVQHPDCNIVSEKHKGNKVVSSTSHTDFGRYLAILMGLNKWNKKVPLLDNSSVYNQYGEDFGSQLEILSLTLKDKVEKEQHWFTSADYNLEILDYWQNCDNLISLLAKCGLTPLPKQVNMFSAFVAESNMDYYNQILTCFNIVNLILNKIESKLNLNFFQYAVVYGQLLKRLEADHQVIKLLSAYPNSTNDFIEAFRL